MATKCSTIDGSCIAPFLQSQQYPLARRRSPLFATDHRLLLQSADSTRRLQELLHECVGEYEKARLRGARRRRLSAEACDSVLAGKILDLRYVCVCLYC